MSFYLPQIVDPPLDAYVIVSRKGAVQFPSAKASQGANRSQVIKALTELKGDAQLITG